MKKWKARHLLIIVLFVVAMGSAYKYGRKIERVTWQEAIYGRGGNPHKILAGRMLLSRQRAGICGMSWLTGFDKREGMK